MTASYFHTWWGNFNLTNNVAVGTDYNPYCITAPVDSRLPGGGGNQVCGFFDISPSKFGKVDNLVQLAKPYGDRTLVYDGFEFATKAQFGHGGIVSGGIAFGKTVTDNCASPNFAGKDNLYGGAQVPAQWCKNSPPFSADTQIKFSGAYSLKWGIQVAGAIQNQSGRPIAATVSLPNTQIAPSLGRNLAACGAAVTCTATATVQLVEPNTLFEDRYTLVDVRLSKVLRMGRLRLTPKIDVYNLFNSAGINSIRNTFGATWRQPLEIFGARFLKLGAQLDF